MTTTHSNNFDFDDEPTLMAYPPLLNQLRKIKDIDQRRAQAIQGLPLELSLLLIEQIDIKGLIEVATLYPELKPEILNAAYAFRGEDIIERRAAIEPPVYKNYMENLELELCQGENIGSIPETSHDKLFAQATKLIEDKKREEMLALFKDNHYSEYYLEKISSERAMAMLYRRKYEMSSDCMRIRQLIRSRDVDMVYWTANLDWLSGHIDLALKQCERLKKRTKNKFEVYLTMADIYLSAGNYGEALDSYNMALSIRDNVSLLRCCKGMALKALGDQRDADACFKSALSLSPWLPQYCIEMALHWTKLNRSYEARLFLDRAQAVLSVKSRH